MRAQPKLNPLVNAAGYHYDSGKDAWIPIPRDCGVCGEANGAEYGSEGKWYCSLCWQTKVKEGGGGH